MSQQRRFPERQGSRHERMARLRQVLATEVGLLSATDARVFIRAIRQTLPLLTRDAEDFTDLHDLIIAAGGHRPGVLIVASTTTRVTT